MGGKSYFEAGLGWISCINTKINHSPHLPSILTPPWGQKRPFRGIFSILVTKVDHLGCAGSWWKGLDSYFEAGFFSK